ncbi:uncharacterized protein RAG0_06268 [Rhynchosporium agropyri]|uniref:BTB domain-containing protein n=1 Tax=Rhynchosporium agropyri TaxID=914238 RepID=A0A1E1KGM1_9HELO|nr:uncharacterized protein RAG0_06268 [Rhynchosporium agropyri]
MLTIPPAKNSKLDDVENAAPTFRQSMGSEVVELFVGSEKIKFIADKDLLCAKVPYFEKMYRGGFSEATTNSANFAGDTVESFDILLGWLYSGGLRARTDNRIFFGWGPIDKLDETVDLYLTAAVESNLFPVTEVIKDMYQESAPDSRLRKLAFAIFRNTISYNKEEAVKTWPTIELSTALIEMPSWALNLVTALRNGDKVEDPREAAELKCGMVRMARLNLVMKWIQEINRRGKECTSRPEISS